MAAHTHNTTHKAACAHNRAHTTAHTHDSTRARLHTRKRMQLRMSDVTVRAICTYLTSYRAVIAYYVAHGHTHECNAWPFARCVQVRDSDFASVTSDHELKQFFVVRNFAGLSGLSKEKKRVFGISKLVYFGDLVGRCFFSKNSSCRPCLRCGGTPMAARFPYPCGAN